MRAKLLALVLLALVPLLSACRFAAVETAPVRVEVPAAESGEG